MQIAAEAAVVEWPQEQRNRLSAPVLAQQRLADVPPEFISELKENDSFDSVVQDLVDAFSENAEPQAKVNELSRIIDQQNTFGDYDETVRQIVLALASVEALQRTPTREMWEYLWSLAWHSAQLETYLPQAVIAAATDTTFREQFFAVANSVVEEAVQNPGRRAIQRFKEIGPSSRKHWREIPQLSALWRGLNQYQHGIHAVDRDDDHVLTIVAEIDIGEFVRLLAQYDYPDPVAHALMWCGAPVRFERWRAIAEEAPTAFGNEGEWNQSLILPLLLGIARDQFQFNLSREPTEDEVSEATSNIKNLSAEIAKVIARRTDAIGCMTRWGNWLVRATILAVSANRIPHPTNAASQGFIDDSLFDALIGEMSTGSWSEALAPDAESWEPWCQYAASTLIALAGKGSMPSAEVFIAEWKLSPEDWSTARGQSLRFHAAPFEGGDIRADGYGARILAIPFVGEEHPGNLWEKFWDSTINLRELVEFGDPDDKDEAGWRGRMDAANLLKLQFSIGLMVMDHLIAPPIQLNFDRSTVIESLLRRLSEAVNEMSAIDQLNRKYWAESLRHLAIRRVKWLPGSIAPSTGNISSEARPTLADFIKSLAGDTENLLSLVYVARQNDVESAVLTAAFEEAQVDLGAEIAIADNLLAISPRTIALEASHLNAVRELLRQPESPPGI